MGEKSVELAWTVKRCFASFGLLVHFVDNEARQDCVNCETVNGHEESSDCEGNDKDDLRIRIIVPKASREAR